ncbi:phage tail spike protein [Macrococcoides caseolyticum]|uniref:Uncharacterized protein n=1 Tax=Macrococcoides caseolyticum TaxID=69966 RepID=A0ACC9MUY5_9STAP|nr:phage tail spike protein [Macrococcus caseolyticus]PKE57489.1 hypothetical protein CW682_00020 [Macrococcus caseolyticus]
MIYLFDVKKELIKVIPRRNIVSAIQELEINGLYTAEIEVPLFYKTEQGQIFNHKKSFDNALFFGHFDYRKKFQLYKIHNRKIDGKQLIITGVHLFFDEAKAMSVIRDKRLINADARNVANVAFEGTGWTVRDYDTTKEKNIDLYYMTPIDARKLIIEEYNVEFDYDFSFDGRKITSKNIYIRNKLGRWTGDRYHYGTNILSITQEQDDAEVYTAAIGRGTSDDTNTALNAKVLFDDLTWSKDGYNKPLGQDYLEIVSATEKYGYYDEKTARIKPRIAIIEFSDIQDQKVLADKTWEWLKQNCVPKVTYSTTVSKVGEYYLGDEIAIIYKEIDIIKKARVENMRVNLLNHDSTELGLGDYTYFKQDKYRERISNEIKETKKEANSYIVKLKKEFDANFEEQTLSFAKAIEQVKINAQSEVESAEKRLSDEIDNGLSGLRQPNALPSSVLQIDELLINRLISDNMFANTLGSNYLFSEIIKTKSLEAVNANISNLRSNILTSNVIKAEHIDSGTALIDKLFSNSANITRLTSKSAFIKEIQAIEVIAYRLEARDKQASVNIENGSITMNRDNGSRMDISLNGIQSFNSGGSLLFSLTPTLVTTSAVGTSVSNVYLGTAPNAEARVVNMNGIPGDGEIGSYAYRPIRTLAIKFPLNANGYIGIDGSELRIMSDGLVEGGYKSVRADKGYFSTVDANNEISGAHFYIRPKRGGELRATYNDGGETSYANFRSNGIYAPWIDYNGHIPGSHFYIRPAYGGEVRLTATGTTNNWAKLRSDGIYAPWIDYNGHIPGSHLYIRPGSGGEVKFTRTGTTDVWADIRFGSWNAMSHEKYKNNIEKWNYNVLDIYKNDLVLHSYKVNSESDTLYARIHHGIVIRENSNFDQFPVEWRNGDGFDGNEVIWWNTKAVQELAYENDELRNKISDLENRLKILEDKLNG